MRRLRKGQIVVFISLAIPALLGAMSLGVDLADFYYNWMILQKAADAGALAGATYLPDNPTTAISTAKQFAQSNGVKLAEITSTTVTNSNSNINIQIQRTLPYYFARLVGLSSGVVSVSSTAAPQYPPSTIGASTASQVSGGDNNGNNGTYCSGTGTCSLLPIGLNSTTTYVDGQSIALQQGQVKPGNWDLLALGGVGGNNLRSNIATGYSGPVSINDWVTTEPGKKVGPVDQGIQDRLDLATTLDPSGTYSSHKLNNPRLVILPVVNWQGQGRTSVQVTAFASVWIDSYSGGTVNVHMVSQVVGNSFGNKTASYFGAKGAPILIK